MMLKAILSEEKKDELYRLNNDLYHLHFEEEAIPQSPTAWLNDPIMDATKRLICKKLGAHDDYESILIVQKHRGAPYRAVKNEHIQLLHDGSAHW